MNNGLRRKAQVVRMEYLRDEVDRALDAVDAKDYAAAVAILEPLVERGNAKACLNMAFLYSLGWGVQLDALKAAEMYEPVGRLGIRDQLISALAYQNLSVLYITGRPEFPRDREKAAEYSRMAEELGLPGNRFGGSSDANNEREADQLMMDANSTIRAIVPPEPDRPDYGSRRDSKIDELWEHTKYPERIWVAFIAAALLAVCCSFIF